jgi:hypothetical protein
MRTGKAAGFERAPGDGAVLVAVAPTSGTSSDRMLTRGEVARILGISVSSVRRLEPNALPVVVDENGAHLHSEERVLAYKLERAAACDRSGGDEGALAGAAFERFDRGASAVDVVKELKLTPRVARELLAEWADLAGASS